MNKSALVAFAGLFLASGAAAQTTPDSDTPTDISKGMLIKLNDSGTSTLRFVALLQFWAQYNENNPGTDTRGYVRDYTTNLGVRRARWWSIGTFNGGDQLFLLQVGMNNQSTFNGGDSLGTGAAWSTNGPFRPQVYFHEMQGQQRIWKDYIYIGAGLHYWNGLTRVSSLWSSKALMYDDPLWNNPVLDRLDQAGRMLGFYVKGQVGGLHYRLAFNEPFTPTDAGALSAENPIDYSKTRINPLYQGYADYDFLDVEDHTLPYMVGTYLGKKSIFNIGAGYIYNKNGMNFLDSNNNTQFHDIAIFAVDTFLDIPLGKTFGAITAYAGLIHFDFGKNYVRNMSLLNPGDQFDLTTAVGTASTAGSTGGYGNLVPTVGTGNLYFGQLGYLLPNFLPYGKLQVYGQVSVGKFEFYQNTLVVIPDIGLNYWLSDYNVRVTLNYRDRPVFSKADAAAAPTQTTTKNELTLLTQFYY